MREETRVKIEGRINDIKVTTEDILNIIDKDQYEDFKTRMVEEYNTRTGEELIINSVLKNNGAQEGLTVSPEESGLFPNVHCNPLYEIFKAKGFEAAYKELVDIMENTKKNTPEMVLEFKTENLFLQIIGSENNKAIMKESPYKVIEGTDLICIYKWLVGYNGRGVCSTRIKNGDMANYGLDKFSDKELYDMALENTQRMFPGVAKELMEMLGMPLPDEVPGDERMWIITNEKKINGATSILYEEVLKEVAEKIGGNFYIIPSSIHEVLCVSERHNDTERIKSLVEEVNGNLVENHERLSYNVYLYEVESGSIRVAA